jgi:FAD synthetase
MGKRVLCCGTFDCLHPGHESFLEQAGALGTELFVVVARDENVLRIKGRRPTQTEDERLAAFSRLAVVADVRLGYVGRDLLRVVRDISPDIIALGYDQIPPAALSEAFPQCEIAVMEPYHPEKFKSSLFRRVATRDPSGHDDKAKRGSPAPSGAPSVVPPGAT